MTKKWKKEVLRFWVDESGQDLVEWCLMMGFVAVAAGAIMPGSAAWIATLLEKFTAYANGVDSAVRAAIEVPMSDPSVATVRVICAVFAVLFLGIIVLRRKKNIE